jgi:hypothetical protein
MSPVPPASFAGRVGRLLLLGLLGIAALPIIVVPLVEASGAVSRTGMSLTVLTLAALIQPLMLLIFAVLVGAWLGPRIGATSYVADARPGLGVHLRSVAPLALACGGLLGVLIVGADALLFQPRLPEFFARAGQTRPSMGAGLLAGMLYGGITEEILLRWGMVTILAWGLWRVFDSGRPAPRASHWWSAIAIAALLFGVGHLPAVAATGSPEALLVVRVVLLNSVAGLVYGWLYWRRSLEAAMVAHAATHIAFAVLAVAGVGT